MRFSISDFTRGLWKENPTLVLLLGMCPTLAVSSSAVNGAGMGLATTFVLVGSNAAVSAVKDIVPSKIRIPVYIVVIATFVTIVDLLMQAYAPPALCAALGIFIPLIVVNCIVLGRAEAFASKSGIMASALDGLGMGCGFTLSLVSIGCIREMLTSGSLFDVKIMTFRAVDFMLSNSAPGAFIILGCVIAFMNWLNMRKAAREKRLYTPPKDFDCRGCQICRLKKD